jgi:hypothetical protein
MKYYTKFKKYKENFTKGNENKSLLKKFVLFEYRGEKYYDDLKKFLNEKMENICGNKNKRSRKNYYKKN